MRTTNKNAPMATFTQEQEQLIAHGARLTSKLQDNVALAFGIKKLKHEPKRHHYIYSPPGAGKTFTVQATADAHGFVPFKIQGAASMNAVMTKIASAVYTLKGPITIWVDDCDSLFMDPDSLNVMKGALDEERNMLSWNKNLTTYIGMMSKSKSPKDQLIAEALASFQQPGSVGVDIPTDRVRFIITSNRVLTPPNSALNTARKMHEAAIRDRVNYTAFDLTPNQSWGWIAHVLLNNKVLDLNKKQKIILLNWMWENWDRLPATSMRAVKDLAAQMLNDPNNFLSDWELGLMKESA